MLRLALCLLVAVCLAGCQSTGPKTQTGIAAGAVLGAVIGAAAGDSKGALLGGVIGAALGGVVGSILDEEDRRRRSEALARAMHGQRPTTWRNPDSGASGSISPGTFFRDAQGRTCSEVQFFDRKAGKTQQGKSVHCLT